MSKPRAAPLLGRLSSQSGLSLLEIIVYAALSILLIGLAMGALGTVQKGVSKSGEMARMHGEADEAMQVISRDLRNLGLKRLFYKTGPGVFVDTLLTQASYAPGDSSSFIHRDGPRYDQLTFLRANLDNRGVPIGVDTVTYGVNAANQTLMRSVSGGGAPVAVCTRVEALQFAYGISARQVMLVNEAPPVAGNWTANPPGDIDFPSATLEISRNTAGTVTAWQSSKAFSTVARRRYAFDFRGLGDDPLMTEVEELEVMVCSPSGTLIASEPFMVGGTLMDYRIEMEVPPCGDCRAGIRMRSVRKGKLILSSFSFSEVSQGDLTWSSAPTLNEKKGVRAVRIYLLAGSDSPIYGANGGSVTLANASLSFNDSKGRSLLDEVVPTPNNGP